MACRVAARCEMSSAAWLSGAPPHPRPVSEGPVTLTSNPLQIRGYLGTPRLCELSSDIEQLPLARASAQREDLPSSVFSMHHAGQSFQAAAEAPQQLTRHFRSILPPTFQRIGKKHCTRTSAACRLDNCATHTLGSRALGTQWCR